MSDRGSETGTSQQKKVAKPRWRTTEYLPEYATGGSETMEKQLLRLHETIKRTFLTYHGCYWADCCFTFETRGTDNQFHRHGHPGPKMKWWPTISEANGLLDYEKFKAYLLNLLPRDSTGKIRVPQCNMKHGVPAPTSPMFRVEESEPEPEPAPVELPVDPVPSKLEALESTVMKITEEKESEKSLIEAQRQTIEALQKENQELKLERETWNERFKGLELVIGSLKTRAVQAESLARTAHSRCDGSRDIENGLLGQIEQLFKEVKSKDSSQDAVSEPEVWLYDQDDASLGKRSQYQLFEAVEDHPKMPHGKVRPSVDEVSRMIGALATKAKLPTKKREIFPK